MSSGNLPPLASKYFIAEPAHHLELVFKRICLKIMAEKETSTVPVSVQHGNTQDSSVFFHVCFSVCVCMLMQVVCGIANVRVYVCVYVCACACMLVCMLMQIVCVSASVRVHVCAYK